MKVTPQMKDLPAEKQAEKAMQHTLSIIADNAQVAWWCGQGSQTYSLLCEATATITGETIETVQACYPPRAPRELKGDELRPCPFCGGHCLEVKDTISMFAVNCEDCDINGPEALTEEEAREDWNRRAIQRL